MGCIDHDPPKTLIGFFCLSYLSDRGSDFGSDILFFFDNILFSEFKLKGGFAGISFYGDFPLEIGKALE